MHFFMVEVFLIFILLRVGVAETNHFRCQSLFERFLLLSSSRVAFWNKTIGIIFIVVVAIAFVFIILSGYLLCRKINSCGSAVCIDGRGAHSIRIRSVIIRSTINKRWVLFCLMVDLPLPKLRCWRDGASFKTGGVFIDPHELRHIVSNALGCPLRMFTMPNTLWWLVIMSQPMFCQW